MCYDTCLILNVTLENGVVTPEMDSNQGIITLVVQCDEDYVAVNGSNEISCQAGSYLETQLPVCLPLCGKPITFENSSYTLSGPSHAYTVTYSCAEGYIATPASQKTVKCINGTYPKVEVECRKICEQPPRISNSILAISGNETDYVASYTCKEGYTQVVGDFTHNCTNGEVTGVPPLCGISCPEPPQVNNSFYTVTRQVDGGLTVKYTCVQGCTISAGDQVLHCSNGIYIGCVPVCTPICPEPELIPFAATPVITGESFEKSAVYHCIDGYERYAGNTTLLCQDGIFVGEPLTCVKTCPTYKTHKHITCLETSERTYDVSYNCTCRPGLLKIEGTEYQFHCSNGTFTEEPLQCEPACSFSYDSVSTSCDFEGEIHSLFVNCSCKDGYHQVSGDQVRSCSHGAFNGSAIICAPSCPLSYSISNGNCSVEGNVTEAKITCNCLDGFVSTNDSLEVNCHHGVMDSFAPVCTAATALITTTTITNSYETTKVIISDEQETSDLTTVVTESQHGESSTISDYKTSPVQESRTSGLHDSEGVTTARISTDVSSTEKG